MDFQAHQQALLDHYIRMAQIPGAKAHAWHRVNELAKQCPELYRDLPARLTEAMRKDAADAPSSKG